MKKIKYGIVGAGTMAREHILNISLINNAEVVALADPHEDSLNQKNGNIFQQVYHQYFPQNDSNRLLFLKKEIYVPLWLKLLNLQFCYYEFR